MSDQNAIRRWFHDLTQPRGVPTDFSKASGVSLTRISRMRNLAPTNPKNEQQIPMDVLQKAAHFFNSLPPGYEGMTNWLPRTVLTETTPQEVRISNVVMRRAAVDGKVEAGSWREVNDFDQDDPRFLDVPADEEFPHAGVRVFEIAGDSMNAYAKAPLQPGALAICLDFDDVEDRMPLRNGMVVVVERTSSGGQFVERSIKEVEIHDGHYEFHPRSTNPAHKPIVVPMNFDADDGVTIRVKAVLRRVTTDTIRF